MIDATCGHCGATTRVKPYRLKRSKSGKIFCSPKCQTAHRDLFVEARESRRTGRTLECPICGRSFYRPANALRDVNYCSYECVGRAAIARGTLPPAPKGVRRSQATEFQSGTEAHNRLPVGSVTIRFRKRDNEHRAWVKVAEPNRWRERARVVWEDAHGPVPAGVVIHHKNRDPLDDRIENLEALTRAEHVREHAAETHA